MSDLDPTKPTIWSVLIVLAIVGALVWIGASGSISDAGCENGTTNYAC